MEQLFEEYGGAVIAIIAAVVMMGIFFCLIGEGGALYCSIIANGNGAC